MQIMEMVEFAYSMDMMRLERFDSAKYRIREGDNHESDKTN